MKKNLILFTLILVTFLSNAQRRYYGGGRHTSSHGGYYPGGHGSSHKGGHYRNTSSYNHYGIHKYYYRRKRG